jgi:uncharacterized protein (TIGR02271 family)
MANTVIGVYDNYSDAQRALNALLESGFSQNDIRLSPDEDTPDARQTSLRGSGQTDDGSDSGWGIGKFFSSLFGGGEKNEDVHVYSEAVRRGSYLLTVDADSDQQRDKATDILNRFDPVDIDERSTQWRSQGWSEYDRSAPMLNDQEIQQERSMYAPQQTQQTQQTQQKNMRGGTLEGEAKIQVMEEQLQVGKREVQRGGVRVVQRMTETPAEESVQLREEHVKVERRPVNQPATEADMAAFKEGSMELRETAEEPVVGKTARVVEEVVVGKDVSQRTETVKDTVRRTDVDIEQLGAQTNANAGRAGMAGDDTDFRTHWQTAYGSIGGKYEDYAPAYQYGSKLGGNEQYKGYRWNDVEPEARREWESNNAGSPWEKTKDAVRYGWEKMTK